jgi:hypothetical protein
MAERILFFSGAASALLFLTTVGDDGKTIIVAV